MLLHIHGSAITHALSQGASAEGARDCLEILLVAHYQGDHVVSMERDDIVKLRASGQPWSRKATRALGHIEENHSQIAGLRAELTWIIEVGVGDAFDGKVDERNAGQAIIRVNLGIFDRTDKALYTMCLGENKTDAKLFIGFALVVRAALRWDNMHVVHEPRGGGGDTTVKEFQGAADLGRIILAIADADETHPGSGYKQTFLKLANAAKDRPAYQRARPLHVRTAEGLIAVDIYQEVLAASPQRRLGVDRIAQLLKSAPQDILRYAHLKEGIRLYQVENEDNEAFRLYWSDIAKKTQRDRCNQPSSSRCTKRENCTCYVVDALGGGALENVVSWIDAELKKKDRASKKRLAQRLGLSTRENPPLTSLAHEVLSWGIAFAPLT